VTRLLVSRCGVRIPAEARDLFFQIVLPAVGPTNGYREIKRPGREVDHSPPSSADVKNEWSPASAPTICLHGLYMDFYIFFLLVNKVYELLMRRRVVWYIRIDICENVGAYIPNYTASRFS